MEFSSFAKLFTGIGNAGFKGSSIGSSGNFDGGCYGFGKGSPYYRGPPEPEVRISRMDLPVYVPPYVPIYQHPSLPIETLRLELRQEETSLRMRQESSLAFNGFELKQSFDYEYKKKTNLLEIVRERRTT